VPLRSSRLLSTACCVRPGCPEPIWLLRGIGPQDAGMGQITVTAGEGRTFPMHHTIATAPGGTLLLLRPGDELEVDDSHTSVQRGLRNGDVVKVANPRARPSGERFSPAIDTLSSSGPPAAFGDLPPLDRSNPGPHTAGPTKAS